MRVYTVKTLEAVNMFTSPGDPVKSGRAKIVRNLPNPEYVPVRLCKIGGKDCVGMVSPVSYTQVVYNTAGSYTFTVPDGVTSLRVTVCGGGAGGVTTAFYKRTCPTYTLEGFPGGDTYVGSIRAYGGKAGKSVMDGWSYKPEQGANVTGGVVGETRSVQTQDFDLAGYGFKLSTTRQAVKWNTAEIGYWRCYETAPNHKTWFAGSGTVQSHGYYGCGGSTHHYYDSDGWTLQVGVAGNSGGFLSQVDLPVTPGQNLPVVVGAGGEGSIYESDTDRWRFNAANGTSGFAIIEYGFRNKLICLVGGDK